jgi:murein L,D-transpeptidase YafK
VGLLIGYQSWFVVKITIPQALISFNYWYKQIARFYCARKIIQARENGVAHRSFHFDLLESKRERCVKGDQFDFKEMLEEKDDCKSNTNVLQYG